MQNNQLEIFLQNQIDKIPLAATNYQAVNNIQTKTFNFDTFQIFVHFNKARAISSLAKLDAKTILSRKCFLCSANRPAEQDSIDFKSKYDLCINPYPICNKHFTVISKQHELQTLNDEKLIDFLDLAKTYPNYTALFNGAKAGASAPDHFHFQLTNSDYYKYSASTPMPELINKQTIKSNNQSEIINWFNKTVIDIDLINLFGEYKNDEWIVTIFPRICHRPNYFYAEDETQLLMSPGAIDMTGNLIVAREQDFNKITKEIIIDIYKQVSLF